MKYIRLFLVITTLFATTTLLLGCGASKAPLAIESAGWPQWHGPNRDGVSQETGLIKGWPESGPPVVWRVPIGDSYSGISISKGRAYTMSTEGENELVVCLDTSNGAEIWRTRIDAKFGKGEGEGPRSTPTVDGERVFALSGKGRLAAFNTTNGEKLWEHDFVGEFGSNIPGFGFCTSPLVEGDLLLAEVGGEDNKSIVAFDKESGRIVWSTHTDRAGYSSPIAITFNGIRQLIFLTSKTLISVSPTDGHIYWEYPWITHGGINVATPILIPPDQLFISASYDKGAALVKMTATDEGVTVEEIWKSRVMKNHFNSSVLLGEHLYGFDNAVLKCITAGSGEEQWKHGGFGKGSLILADGYLIVLSDDGRLVLVEATPLVYIEKAIAQVLEGKCWTVPSLADGKLYLRTQKEVVCLDLTQSPVQKASLGATRNVHRYRDFYLAGQPSEADLQEAKNVGIKTVVNLRMPKELAFHEKEIVDKLGMAYHNPGISAPEMMTDQLFSKIRGILNDSEHQPVLLHCGSANRVGAIWLAYRVLDGGLSYEAALSEAKTVGLRSPAMEEKAKDYIERNR